MENRKITIKSLTGGTIGIKDLYLHLDMTWNKKGAKKLIDLETLSQAMSTPGIMEMFTEGYLGIDEKDSLEILKYLGLEEADAEEPTNIIVLTEQQKKRLMSTAPIGELQEMLKKLSYEQMQQLADCAIENELADLNRSEIIKNAIGIDIIQAIKLKREEAEDVPAENVTRPANM